MDRLFIVLAAYTLFLFLTSLLSFIFSVEYKKPALSSLFAGLLAMVAAYLTYRGTEYAYGFGIGLSLLFMLHFAWKASNAFSLVIDGLISRQDNLYKSKGINFLIFSMLFIASFVVTILQIVY
ncbi:MAG: hypothetical protein ACK40G_00395 [Cytophagaceae bacterium]